MFLPRAFERKLLVTNGAAEFLRSVESLTMRPERGRVFEQIRCRRRTVIVVVCGRRTFEASFPHAAMVSIPMRAESRTGVHFATFGTRSSLRFGTSMHVGEMTLLGVNAGEGFFAYGTSSFG